VITTVAGNGAAGFSGEGGPATSAQLSSPNGVAVDGTGNLYIADGDNKRVRKVSAGGVIGTVAGSGTGGVTSDGVPATSAQLGTPYGVAIDAAGNLYIADTLVVRRVSADGIISTVVPSQPTGRFNSGCQFSGDGGPATSASVCRPMGVAVDAAGNLYVADSQNQRIRKVTTDGVINTVAGNGAIGFSGDGGPAISTSLGNPFGVAVDSGANIYIADTTNNRVRKVTGGVISTSAGNGTAGFAGDGGPAVSGQLYFPAGVAVDGAGNLYIADTRNNRVRKVTADSVISTLSGNGTAGFSGDGGPANLAELYGPSDVVVDAAANVYILDRGNGTVRKITADRVIRTVAGTGSSNCISPDGGQATSTPLCNPQGIAVDTLNNLYIAERSRVRKVGANGVITTVAGNGTEGYSGDGGPATSARLISAYGVAVDGAGNLYISDIENHRVRKVTLNGVITTVAGTGIAGFSGDGGPAVSAQLYFPAGLAVDGAGNLYIADVGNQRIRKITAAGVISTVAGKGASGFSGDAGLATSAQLSEPYDVAVDGAGNLYIADIRNSRIRKVSPAAAVQPYSIANSGANFWTTTLSSGPITVGYGRIQPAPGSAAPNGVAVFSYRSNGVLVSEVSVPASPLLQTGRIYAESSGRVRTGIALANPNDQDATVLFYFTDKDGVNFNSGTTILTPHQQLAAFLDEAPFRGNDNARSFTFTSSVPVGATALRGNLNERGDFLMTALPVARISSTSTAKIILPHFAAGGGWTTQILLVNPTDEFLSGSVDLDAAYTYVIAPRSAVNIRSSSPGSLVRTGIARITAAPGSRSPIASSVFTFVSGGITVSESGVATTGIAQSFRIFAEFDSAQAMKTGIAIANTASTVASIQFELLTLSGQPSGYFGSTTIDSSGHLALFLNEIPGLENLPSSFRGVLRVSSNTSISAVGLRARYNERGDFLISTTPAIAADPPISTEEVIFPQVVTGSGYTTEFVLMSTGGASTNTPAAGNVVLASQTGTELPLQLLR